MEGFIDILVSNKTLLIIAVIASIIIVLSVIKKIVKLALICLAVIVLYIGYLVYTGKPVPRNGTDLIRQGTQQTESKSGGRR